MGNSALHYCIIEKRNDVLKELFNHDVNYNNTNMNGNTALHLLINENDININIEKQHDIDILSISGKNDKRNVSCSYRLKPNTFDYSNYMLKLELGILNIQLNRLPSVDLNSSIELKF
jgi:ankyrin repeat protein